MEFLYPQFLYGLAALAIPVIIHLFNFRKAKKVYFSNNFFLKNLKKISSSKLKLRHYLILASRLLFITFLVLAFAQPFLPAAKKKISNENVLIYMDNSFSMSSEVSSGLSAFEQSIAYVEELTRLYPAGTRFKLLTNDFAPYSNRLKSREEIGELITEIDQSGIARSLEDIHNRLTNDQQSSAADADIYLISDFQKSTLGILNEIPFDSAYNYYLMPMSYKSSNNVYVDSIFLENPFLMMNEDNELHVILANGGREDVQDISVKLFVNNTQTANLTLDIPANSKGNISFPLSFGLDKINECRITLEDYPISFDNAFYFTLNLTERINILEIKGNQEVTNSEYVFANRLLFNFSSFHIDNLDYSLINSSDLIILNQLNEMDAALLGLIKNKLEAGSHLAVIPPDLPSMEFMSELTNIQIAPVIDAVLQPLVPPDLNNPFFENIFEEADPEFSMPEARKVLSWNNSVENLLQFRNGNPYLSMWDVGKGRIYLFGSPLAESFTGLTRHAIYVPVMYKMAVLSKEVTNDLYHTLDESILQLKLDTLVRDQIYRLKSLDNEIIPPQQQSGNILTMELPKYQMSSGFYQLLGANDIKTILAFNQRKAESVLAQYDPEELASQIRSGAADVEVYDFNDTEEFGREVKNNRTGTPYWKYAVLLALFFLLTEIILIRFF